MRLLYKAKYRLILNLILAQTVLQAKSLRESLSKVSSWDKATDYNQTTQFMGWLSEADPHFANVVGSNPTLTRYQQDKLNGMINTYVDQAYMPDTPQMPNHAVSNIQSNYQNAIAKVNSNGSKGSVQGAYTLDAANTKTNFKADASNDGHVQGNVSNEMVAASDLIKNASQIMNDKNNHLESQVTSNISKDKDIAKEGPLSGAFRGARTHIRKGMQDELKHTLTNEKLP